MKKSILFFFSLFISISCFAQFPPGANMDGTTAISAEDPIIQAWATSGTLELGMLQINDPESGFPDMGTLEEALGVSDGVSISLGDAGVAILEFDSPIRDGEAWDFVIFENGFAVGPEYFLELAFVEVSSDGQHFVRFPAISLTDTTTSIGSFGTLDPTKLHNLAGKYESGYGVPFDLSELADEENLDIENITHVKIIDVIGSLDDEWASRDAEGRKINDPFPTPFPSSGFDLDAVGVIHQQMNTSTFVEWNSDKISLFPNPVTSLQLLQVNWGDIEIESLQIVDLNGRTFFSQETYSSENPNKKLDLSNLHSGIYVLQLKSSHQCWTKPFVVR